jgi:hypothetical protein
VNEFARRSRRLDRAEEALRNKAEGISEREFFGAELCRLEREANREITEFFIITAEEGSSASVTRMPPAEFFHMIRGYEKGADIAGTCRVFTSQAAAEAAAEKHNTMNRILVRLRGLDTDRLKSVLGAVEQEQLDDAAKTLDEALS